MPAPRSGRGPGALLTAGILAGAFLSSAAAQIPTTTVTSIPATTTLPPSTTTVTSVPVTTTIGASTTTVSSSSVTSIVTTSSTSTSSSSSTSTSTTVPCSAPPPPRECAADAGSKEECLDCCSEEFDAQVGCSDDYACEGWRSFIGEWRDAGEQYGRCLREEGFKFPEGLPGACYDGALHPPCASVAGRHPEQCQLVKDCVSCCATQLRRRRASALRKLKKGTPREACRAAAQRLRKALRKRTRCKKVCRARTCTSTLATCFAYHRDIKTCFEKCHDKCLGNAAAYNVCLGACRDLHCDTLQTCYNDDNGGGGGCLAREEAPDCVQATTSTSTSSSSTVTSTSTSTSTTL